MLALLVLRLRRGADAGQRLPVPRDPDPVPDPVAGGARAEHPGGLLRPDLARAPAPSWRSAPTRPTTSRARRRHAADRSSLLLRRRCARPPSACCSASRACASRGSTSRWRRWPRSSSSTGCSARQVVHQRLVVGLGQRRARWSCSASRSTRRRSKYLFVPRARRACSRWWRRTWCAAPSAASGWPCATWTWPPR